MRIDNGDFSLYGESLTRKLQQFFIYKIPTSHLIDSKYNVSLSIDDSRRNQELVSISDSELIRVLFRLTSHPYSASGLEELTSSRAKIKKYKNTESNRKTIQDLTNEIDQQLFIEEIVSIEFSDKRHAKSILENKNIIVNDFTYVPFMASTGMIRRNMMLFIKQDIFDKIIPILENGFDRQKELVPAKYGTYFSLYSSSSLDVTFPKIAIVSDKIIETVRRIDYSTIPEENFEKFIEETEMSLSLNAFDGQGLVSPKMAKIWSKDLDLSYIPSAFIVRGSFLKGLCVVFDFHKLAKESSIKSIVDIYGNNVDIEFVDVIVSESQFKLWNCYKNTKEYVENCISNNLGWGITRVSPKEEKNYAFSSYQFIQSLKLQKDEIEKITEPTKSWLNSVSGYSLESVLLYFLGDLEIEDGWFDRLDNSIKALILENSLLDDDYFFEMFKKYIQKRENDSCMGRLLFPANYQFMISDPYAQACHILGIDFKSLLIEGECYSNYWNKKESSRISLVRSPIVHYSEVDSLSLNTSEKSKQWYKHITSGIIFPPYGISLDMGILGGADVDGDICFSTNYQTFINGKITGTPIFYDTLLASKSSIGDIGEVLKSQSKGLGTKVGFLTNIGSSLVSMLSDYDEYTKEYEMLFERYKYIRVAQGLEIDKQKGLLIPDFPKWWTKRKKIKDEMTDEEKLFSKINNSIIVDKRPYFFIYLYDYMKKKWREEKQSFDNYSLTKYGITIDELSKKQDKTIEEIKIINDSKKYSSFIDNDSTMNLVSHHMEDFLKKVHKNKKTSKFDFKVLLSNSQSKPNKTNLEKIKLLFKEYKSLKRSLINRVEGSELDYNDYNEIKKYINKKAYSAITSNSTELTDMLIYSCYKFMSKSSKRFLWDCFGLEIVENILSKNKNKFVRIPMKNDKGDIEYMFSKYSMYMVNIKN